jgi:hypothetical protein
MKGARSAATGVAPRNNTSALDNTPKRFSKAWRYGFE